MTTPVIILGSGDLAREVFATCLEAHPSWGEHRPLAFVDDNPERVGEMVFETPVWSWSQCREQAPRDARFICAVGSIQARQSMLATLKEMNPEASFATVVHKGAVVMPHVVLQPGVFVAANATLAIASEIEEHVVINQNCSIGHDCRIGARTVISPGCILSGRTRVGADSFLGSGSITYPGASIGQGCTLSAHAVIARRLKDGQKAIAKPNVMVL